MKTALLLSAFFVAATAQAEIKKPGTFVASQCSRPSNESGDVERVCLGSIVGDNQKAIRIQLIEGGTMIYAIQLENNLSNRMGVSRARFEGNLMKGRRNWQDKISGVVERMSGITVTYRISLNTDSGLEFTGSLWPMMTTK